MHSLTYSLAHSLIITAYPGRYASTIKAFQVEGGIGSTYVAEGKQVLGKIECTILFSHLLTHSLFRKEMDFRCKIAEESIRIRGTSTVITITI